MASRVVGLDIGRDSIRAVEVENADKVHPTIARYHQVALPDGAVRSGEVRELDTVTAAIKQLWSVGGFTSKKVVLGMANQRVLVRDLTVPKMSIAQIKESLPFQVQDMLPVPVGEALLDFYPVSEGQGDQGPVVNGLLIAAIKESVLANVDAVRQAGLDVVEVDLIPFALSRALINDGNSAGTVVLIDIGASTTNVVVSRGGVPQFVRMIPFGGQAVTDAIGTRLEVSVEEAEALKRERGLGAHAATSEHDYASIEIIRASTLELLNAIRNTLHFFSSTRPTDVIDSILLSGGGAQLPGLAQALGDMTRTPIVAADAFALVDTTKTVKNSVASPGGMTVALGLALGSAA